MPKRTSGDEADGRTIPIRLSPPTVAALDAVGRRLGHPARSFAAEVLAVTFGPSLTADTAVPVGRLAFLATAGRPIPLLLRAAARDALDAADERTGGLGRAFVLGLLAALYGPTAGPTHIPADLPPPKRGRKPKPKPAP